MRTFINYLLTIALFITIIITITIFTIGNLTDPNSTREILNNIDYEKVINNFKNTDYGNEIYNYIDGYGISEKQIDSILQTEEAKDYINEMFQQGINAYLNNSDIKIDTETKNFINKANEKYELGLNEKQESELETYISEEINNNLNIIINKTSNDNNNTVSSSGEFLIDIIKFCKDDNLNTTLYISIVVIAILLFINSFKKKNFLEYIAIVSITVAISTLLFNSLVSLISNRIASITNISIILKPITDRFYMITFIGIILGIILLIIQHFINKQINKEVVPF